MKQQTIDLSLATNRPANYEFTRVRVFSDDHNAFRFVFTPPENMELSRGVLTIESRCHDVLLAYDLPADLTWVVPDQVLQLDGEIFAEVTLHFVDGSNNVGRFQFNVVKSMIDGRDPDTPVPVTPNSMPIATKGSLGGVQIGEGLEIDDLGVITLGAKVATHDDVTAEIATQAETDAATYQTKDAAETEAERVDGVLATKLDADKLPPAPDLTPYQTIAAATTAQSATDAAIAKKADADEVVTSVGGQLPDSAGNIDMSPYAKLGAANSFTGANTFTKVPSVMVGSTAHPMATEYEVVAETRGGTFDLDTLKFTHVYDFNSSAVLINGPDGVTNIAHLEVQGNADSTSVLQRLTTTKGQVYVRSFASGAWGAWSAQARMTDVTYLISGLGDGINLLTHTSNADGTAAVFDDFESFVSSSTLVNSDDVRAAIYPAIHDPGAKLVPGARYTLSFDYSMTEDSYKYYAATPYGVGFAVGMRSETGAYASDAYVSGSGVSPYLSAAGHVEFNFVGITSSLGQYLAFRPLRVGQNVYDKVNYPLNLSITNFALWKGTAHDWAPNPHDIFAGKSETVLKSNLASDENLLTGTSREWQTGNSTYWGLDHTASNGMNLPLTPGQTYTYRVKLQGSPDFDRRVEVQTNPESVRTEIFGSFVKRGTTGYSTLTFTVPENATSVNLYPARTDRVIGSDDTTKSPFQWAEEKLNLGSYATPYSDAPVKSTDLSQYASKGAANEFTGENTFDQRTYFKGDIFKYVNSGGAVISASTGNGTKAPVKQFAGTDTGGDGLAISAGGLTVVGGGEAADSLYTAIANKTLPPAIKSIANAGDESTVTVSDSQFHYVGTGYNAGGATGDWWRFTKQELASWDGNKYVPVAMMTGNLPTGGFLNSTKDLDSYKTAGIYATSNSINSPENGDGVLLVIHDPTRDASTQLWFGNEKEDSKLYYRSIQYTGGWGAWQRFLTGKMADAAYQPIGDYVKSADLESKLAELEAKIAALTA
ncbi:pyocin knob domain-containing protein [Lacticaseibacillus suihuaensis]